MAAGCNQDFIVVFVCKNQLNVEGGNTGTLLEMFLNSLAA